MPRRRDLGITLDATQLLHNPINGDQFDSRGTKATQTLDKAIRHRTLEADTNTARCQIGQPLERETRDVPVEDLDIEQCAQRLDGFLVAEVRNQHGARCRKHDDAI